MSQFGFENYTMSMQAPSGPGGYMDVAPMPAADPAQTGIVQPGAQVQSLSTGRLYVGNLSWNVAWQDLKDYFKQCGHVVRADVMTGSDGRSKGCGLVEFETPEQAMTAIATLNDTELKGRPIFVREDRESPGVSGETRRTRADRAPKGESSGTSVYVGNLPWDVTWHQLKDHFRANGIEARRVEVASSANGRSKGYGIVKFDNVDEANAAVAATEGTEMGTRKLLVRLDRTG